MSKIEQTLVGDQQRQCNDQKFLQKSSVQISICSSQLILILAEHLEENDNFQSGLLDWENWRLCLTIYSICGLLCTLMNSITEIRCNTFKQKQTLKSIVCITVDSVVFCFQSSCRNLHKVMKCCSVLVEPFQLPHFCSRGKWGQL